jgi:hypothetical protein
MLLWLMIVGLLHDASDVLYDAFPEDEAKRVCIVDDHPLTVRAFVRGEPRFRVRPWRTSMWRDVETLDELRDEGQCLSEVYR